MAFAFVPALFPAEEFMWKAGLAKAVITPETKVWLAGYGFKREPEGKIHDLWMKALALEDQDGNRVVLVTSDFQGVPKVMSDPAFALLQERYGLGREQVMITFSHNHCGPRLGDDLIDYYPVDPGQEKLVDAYTAKMVVRMADMIGEALEDLRPAALKQGEGFADFAVNRRNNRESEVPKLMEAGEPLEGPVDHSVPILTVTRPGGKVEAVLFGYACHPTTIRIKLWNGDYPGFAQLELEKRHPGMMALFVNTCGGDQNPLPRRRVELAESYGHRLAVAVEAAMGKELQPVSSGIRTAFEHADLAFQNVMTRESLTPLLTHPHGIKKRWAARMLAKLDTGETFPANYPYPVHAWRLGKEMLMIGMGAETVVDYALRFKREFGAGTWVCGYADDMISYIPTHRVWQEGGYEGGANLFEYGRPALRWKGNVEDTVVASVHKLVSQVGGPCPEGIGFQEAVRIERANLLHTTQLVSKGQKTVGLAVGDFLRQMDKLAQRHGARLEQMVKLNLNCREDWRGELASIRAELLKRPEIAVAMPAITLLPNAVPGGADLAGDAVFNVPEKVSESPSAQVVPAGHEVIYVSGKVGKAEDLIAATHKTMESLGATLESVGCSTGDIVQVKAFINDMGRVEEVRKAIVESVGEVPLVFVEWQWGNTEIELIASLPLCQEKRPEGLSIHTPDGENASPNYSRVSIVRGDKLIYVSAIGRKPGKDEVEATRELLRAQAAALEKVGGDMRHLAKATYYVSSPGASSGLNQVRREFYDTTKPPAASKVMVSFTGGDGEVHLMDLIAVPVE